MRYERLDGGSAAIPHLREAAAPAPARATLLGVLPPKCSWVAAPRGARRPHSWGPSCEEAGARDPTLTLGRKLSVGAAAGAPWEGRAERAASRSLLSALIGPAAGTPGRREGGRKVGTRSPAPSATRPAQPGLNPGGGDTESDAGGRAGGARPLVLLRARRPVSSAHDATSNPGHPGGRLSLERTPCPTLFITDTPPIPVPAPAKISCAFL